MTAYRSILPEVWHLPGSPIASPDLLPCFLGRYACPNTVRHAGESCDIHAPTVSLPHPGWVDPTEDELADAMQAEAEDGDWRKLDDPGAVADDGDFDITGDYRWSEHDCTAQGHLPTDHEDPSEVLLAGGVLLSDQIRIDKES